jgi:pimeloyl-ACP methyl ester carboxylesterase
LSDTAVDADYSVEACAGDVVACLDALGWTSATVVGHSWGAAIALRAAARYPDRVQQAALIDGGLWSPGGMGPRDEVRARLTPPALGIPADELWAMVRSGDLGSRWSDEHQAALELTFVSDENGLLRSRLGLERHMHVLDGLLDSDPAVDLAASEQHGTPVWAVVCQAQGAPAQPTDDLRSDSVVRAAAHSNVLVHRWAGAIHDVPLQWPDLVAGFIDTVASSGSPANGSAAGGAS